MWAQILENLQNFNLMVWEYLPTLLVGLSILIFGWLLAWIISVIVRKALGKTSIDNRIAAWITSEPDGSEIRVEFWLSKAVFYFLMLFVLVAFFQVVGLPSVTEPLNRFLNEVFGYLPRLLGPAILTLVAWILASTLRFIVRKVLETSEIDRKLTESAAKDEEVSKRAIPLSKTLSETVYWLVWLLFLPAILGPLGLQGILSPIQNLVDELLGFLPQLLAAALIFGVGWFVARIVQRILTSLLIAVGLDRFAEQVGVSKALGKQKLSQLLGTIAYVLLLIPVLIGSLDALQIDSITRPASEMLNTILLALPNIFAAFLILAVAYLVGRIVSGLVTSILTSIGFNVVLEKVGFSRKPTSDSKTPSEIAGTLTLIAILLLAASEASEVLGFGLVSELVSQFIVFAGQILLGLVILGIGLFLANFTASTIGNSRTSEARLLANIARISIVVLSAAMALRQMGIANEIIQLAFGLTVGAVAVAVALAFGLGARDAAARQVEEWQAKIKSRSEKKRLEP